MSIDPDKPAEQQPGNDRQSRYLRPKRTMKLFNSAVGALTRAGVSLLGSRELRVRGRASGEIRTTPVNLLPIDGQQYLVAPRGNTQWVRNIRAAGGGELRLGRKITPFRAVEVADQDKPRVLRAYLKRWSWETGVFFDGLTAKATDAELLAAAADFPAFLVR